MLMATSTYLIEVMRKSVQNTSDSMPRMLSDVVSPCRKSKAVLSV
jgi:hypothetical protein